jgi:RND family efflux transporter MFP subunit
MKPWLKWLISLMILALLAAGGLRVWNARKAQKIALDTQTAAQKIQAVVALADSDVVKVQNLDMAQSLPVSGPLKAVTSAFIKARVAGELQDLSVREGDFVKAGQVIARIDATEFKARVRQAQQQAESAKAQVDIAKRSFDNNRSLVDQGFISKTALESSSSSLAAAEANYRAAQAGAELAVKSLDDTVLRSPIAGQIAQRLAQPGERVAVDTRLVEVVDLSRLELEASLSAAESLAVKTGQVASLTMEGSTQTVSARVVRVNPNTVAGSRAVLVYLAVEASVPLRQGMFVQGKLRTGNTRTLALPISAVRTDKPQPYVQAINQNLVVHLPVVLGLRGEASGQTLVSVQGVPENTLVLSGSTGSLAAGTPVTLTPTK